MVVEIAESNSPKSHQPRNNQMAQDGSLGGHRHVASETDYSNGMRIAGCKCYWTIALGLDDSVRPKTAKLSRDCTCRAN